MTDDFPHETANNDTALFNLQDTVRDLQARHETLLEKLSNPTEEMCLQGRWPITQV